MSSLTKNADLQQPIFNVTFEPSARNNWHSHSGGQILIGLSGIGYYQAKGKPAQQILPGTVIEIDRDVIHWHGASADSTFSHLALNCHAENNQVTWLDSVTDDTYQSAIQSYAKNQPIIDNKTFTVSSDVTVENVQFTNRYGILVSGDMYLPKNLDKSTEHPAIIIGTPYGGVKEQGAGIYAMTLAQRGFVTLAFDESYNGESAGHPRHVSSPDIFVEDFSAAVDFIGTRPFVSKDRIGAIGICGSGAFALTAAQVDTRIRAVATASMYDMSRLTHHSWMDTMTTEEYQAQLDKLSAQRWKDFESGEPEYIPSFPDNVSSDIPENLDPITAEFWEYYAMARGNHPRARAGFTTTSALAFSNFPLLHYIETISPRPILFIMGENAHSRYFTEDAYKRAAEPKELHIIPDARHIDLYDRQDMIPFDKLEVFFTEHLQ